jgi:hypothetical protein
MRLLATLIGAACVARAALAQAPPAAQPSPPPATPPKDAVPDLAFLEYLGSWQGDDDEWLAIKEWDQDNVPKKDPAGEHKDPARDAARNGHDKSE